MLRAIRRLGCRLALGSIAPTDQALLRPERALRHVTARLQPGAVVVVHEGPLPGERAVGLVAGVLRELDRRGLDAVTLSDLVEDRPG